MRLKLILMLSCLFAGALFASLIDFNRAPARSDARYAYSETFIRTNMMLQINPPCDGLNGMTVCGWFRVVDSENMQITTCAHYAPEVVNYSNPDLLNGAGGYPADGNWDGAAGTNLTLYGNSITVNDFRWQPYENGIPSSNRWPRGVYTLAGWTSNELTVLLGGKNIIVQPGTFNRNEVPGSSNTVILSGSGQVCIGISRTPETEFFFNIDGVDDTNLPNRMLTANSIVTNEISFCAWRWVLDDQHHVYRSDIVRMDKESCLGIVQTNAMPRRARSFARNGIYLVGLAGLGCGSKALEVDTFDIRVLPGFLSDDELCRIHRNGVDELRRRGISQWK